MPRQKRNSALLAQAEKRMAGVFAISTDLDLGNGITAQGYAETIEALRQKLSAYNELLSRTDMACNAVRDAEREIRDYSERILLGVATRYGKDSNEYEMAGGIRKSERKRPVRKPKSAA